MSRALPTAAIVLFALASLASCQEKDPGPFVVEGWIARCHDSCDQQLSCAYAQLLFDHGDIDNCKRTCGAQLERDENLAFIDDTPDACLETLYAELHCVFALSCEGLSSFKRRDPGAPCEAETAAVATACANLPYRAFREICEYPIVATW